MKKISLFVLVLALCLGLSACGGNASGSSAASASASGSESASESASASASASASESAAPSAESGNADVTVEALVEANTAPALLSNFDNVLMTATTNGEPLSSSFATKDFVYGQLPNGADAINDGQETWTVAEDGNEEKLACAFYAVSDEDFADFGALVATPEEFGLIDPEFTLFETITDITDNGDGTLTISTSVSPEASATISSEAGLDDSEGVEWTFEYVVDKETLAIQKSVDRATKDGAEVLVDEVTVEYNADQPESVAKLFNKIDEFHAADTGETRTVTVVYDVGTPQEKQFSKTIPKTVVAAPVLYAEYEYVYGDPDKKTEFNPSEESDATLYAFTEE